MSWIESLASDEIGKETRHNHNKCGDTRRRLYVKRINSSTCVAHCHNCGWSSRGKSSHSGRWDDSKPRLTELLSGSWNTSSDVGTSRAERSLSSFNQGIRECLQLAEGTDGWSPEARAWVYRYGITDEEVETYQIGYSLATDRVYIPVLHEGAMQGYQLRRLDDSTAPKYLTKKFINTPLYQHIVVPNRNTCVLVEDQLSAIKVARHADAVAILGSHMPDELVTTLMRDYEHIRIWMDNDNDIIKKKQNKYKETLDLFCDDVTIIRTDRDPKEHTDEEILECLAQQE